MCGGGQLKGRHQAPAPSPRGKGLYWGLGLGAENCAKLHQLDQDGNLAFNSLESDGQPRNAVRVGVHYSPLAMPGEQVTCPGQGNSLAQPQGIVTKIRNHSTCGRRVGGCHLSGMALWLCWAAECPAANRLAPPAPRSMAEWRLRDQSQHRRLSNIQCCDFTRAGAVCCLHHYWVLAPDGSQ